MSVIIDGFLLNLVYWDSVYIYHQVSTVQYFPWWLCDELLDIHYICKGHQTGRNCQDNGIIQSHLSKFRSSLKKHRIFKKDKCEILHLGKKACIYMSWRTAGWTALLHNNIFWWHELQAQDEPKRCYSSSANTTLEYFDKTLSSGKKSLHFAGTNRCLSGVVCSLEEFWEAFPGRT